MNKLQILFNHSTKRNLLLLFIVFNIGFLLQIAINYSINNFINALDKRIQNAEIQRIVTSDISLDIRNLESLYYQMAAFPNRHMRRIIQQQINNKETKIYESFYILNNGGTFHHSYDLNLPNADKLEDFLTYQPEIQNHFSFAADDILPKFRLINEKLVELNKQLKEIDLLQETKSPKLSQKITEFQLNMKFFSPIFQRLKESSNQVFYTDNRDYVSLKKSVTIEKERYRNLQILLTITLVLLGLWIFWHLSRGINKSIDELTTSRDYTRDILNSQSNIIIVNDGQKLIDASGGFFSFFKKYHSLESFQNDFDCICDLFVKEAGYIYKFEDQNWIEYLAQNPNLRHKAKVNYEGKITIFQLYAIKSKNENRYIISMLDITEIEHINQSLLIEKNKALAATQAKGEFLANMSHEIRTPLNAILGFIGLLKEKSLDAESKEYVEIIDASSQTLTSIINDILDFSKIESGKLELDPVVFDPNKSIHQVADLFNARCSEKNLNLIIEISEMPDRLFADLLRINQVLSNFLSNAIKFSNSGKTVTLSANYDDRKQMLNCYVIDEGIGIPLDKQANIFESFSQAESSTTRKYGGTGLGLTISAQLISLLGGDIHLKSVEGEGSCFGFSIPAKTVTDQTDQENESKAESLLKGHILLVEDNQTNQMLMSAILKKQGLTFEIANNGVEAIDKVKQQHFDLILMDENMPTMSGIEATQHLRSMEAHGHCEKQTIIALTANAMKGDRERFIAAGMDDYLAKPVKVPKLTALLKCYLNR